MEAPNKRAKACPDGTADDGAAPSTAAKQIAELQAELDECRREKDAMEERHNQTVRDLIRRHDQVVRDLAGEKNSMEERHDQVVRDLKGSYSEALEWVYTLEPTDEDWRAFEEGRSEEYANAMIILQQTFKHAIKKLRTGKVDGLLVLRFDLQDEGGDLVMADHHDQLMPYWMELAKAIIHWSEYHANGETLGLSIVRVQTPDVVLDVLHPAIKQSKVQYLGFISDGSPRTWKFARFMEDVIQSNHTLTQFGLCKVMFSNEELKRIFNPIRIRNAEQSSTVQFFQFSYCFSSGINTEALKEILTTNTVQLDLAGNGMSSRESPIIAEFLDSNPPLARLGLNCNRFDDDDAALLADSLANNTNLRELFIGGNNFTEEGGRLALLRSIFDTTNLASCAASNHTCRVLGLDLATEQVNLDSHVDYNKWDKIFAMLALSSEDEFINTALLSGIPASLMSVLLKKANGQDQANREITSGITELYLELTGIKQSRKHIVWDNLGDSRPLNCVYELFQSLVVPSIYV